MKPKETIEWSLKRYESPVEYTDLLNDKDKRDDLIRKIKHDIAGRIIEMDSAVDDPDRMGFDILPVLNSLYLAWVAIEDLSGGE